MAQTFVKNTAVGIQNVLQVSTADIGSGAEKFACDLQSSLNSSGVESWMAVGRTLDSVPQTVLVPNESSRDPWANYWWNLQDRVLETSAPSAIKKSASWLMRRIAEPTVAPSIYFGIEDFHYPGTSHITELIPEKPDIIHCHNLHGNYFDLRQLPAMSRRFPVVMTLHDTWLLTGHCAYTFGCERYQTGCGSCPDLTIPNPIRMDSTRHNWKRKRSIYANSKLFVATPSQWLMDMVENSMLMDGIAERKVIPNGVDLKRFKPNPSKTTRQELGISEDAIVFLFTATNAQKNVFKDYETLRRALEQLSDLVNENPVTFLTLGGDDRVERIGNVTLQGVPFVKDPEQVAKYYQAADIYLHSTKQDNCPIVVLEALACGLPVIASAVGGVPEQVRGLRIEGITSTLRNKWSTYEANGILVEPGNADEFARCIRLLVANRDLREQLGQNAAADARARYNLDDCRDAYLDFYRLAKQRHAASS